jgi:hypothetical protein
MAVAVMGSLEVLFGEEQNTCAMAHYSAKQAVSLNENSEQEFGSGIPSWLWSCYSRIHTHFADHAEPALQPGDVIAMLKQTFQLNVMDLGRMTRHMQALGRIVPGLPSFRLSMPRDYEALPLVRKKILETIRSPKSSSSPFQCD